MFLLAYILVYHHKQIQMNEHKESQMKEEHIRGQRNNLLEKIYEHKKESLERLTKLKQMLTEEGKLRYTSLYTSFENAEIKAM